MRNSILVIGCGSVGERHIKNLLSLEQEVSVTDIDVTRILNMVSKYRVKISPPSNEFDAFIICTPPDSHVGYARMAIECNAHIFIEKPISDTLDGVDEIIEQAKAKNLVLQVGYQFRFHPGLSLVKQLLDEGQIGKLLSIRAEFGQYLPDWHKDEDYRELYTCRTGIILDASHEIDYVMWLVDSEVKEVSCYYDKLSKLEIFCEDTAEILLRFENGVIGNIHVDCIQQGYRRCCRLIGEDGIIEWDYHKKDVVIATKKIVVDVDSKGTIINVLYNNTDPYLKEMEHFIQCLHEHCTTNLGGHNAKKVLQVALMAKGVSK